MPDPTTAILGHSLGVFSSSDGCRKTRSNWYDSHGIPFQQQIFAFYPTMCPCFVCYFLHEILEKPASTSHKSFQTLPTDRESFWKEVLPLVWIRENLYTQISSSWFTDDRIKTKLTLTLEWFMSILVISRLRPDDSSNIVRRQLRTSVIRSMIS